MGLDPLDHRRLRVGRLVLFVVTETTIADQVDERVAPELPAEIHGEMHRRDAGVDVVGIDVHDRHVEAFSQIRSVACRTPVRGIRREADLVICDQVKRAAGLVTGKRLQIEDFRDDALSRKRGVAMNQDRNRSLAIAEGTPCA